jgi:8-hydroxy-5-deazaflavin:NADPH oxidoreductase
MKVGIIGSGEVGKSLARGFKAEGHDVMLGTRDMSKPDVVEFQKETNIATGNFEKAAAHGELLVLCVKGTVVENAIKLAGPQNFNDKVVIDTTNPIADAPPVNGVLQFFTSLEESLIERIQKQIPQAKLVKSFSCIGNRLMYKPNLPGGKPTMFICGNDAGAKKTVTEILTAFGHETEDMGTMEGGRAIEPLAILWCIPGFLRNEWGNAFKLLKP